MAEKIANQNNSRYRSLIIFITLFVVIIVSVLGLNLYISTQLSDDAAEINLAGRQRMLSQKTAKSLQKLIQAQNDKKDIQPAFEEFKEAYDLFDSTLNAFTNGGVTSDGQGQPVTLKAVDLPEVQSTMSSTNQIWKDYKKLAQPLLEGGIDNFILIAETIDYSSQYNDQILAKMNELTQFFETLNYPGIYINLSGRQRMLSQRISKKLFQINNALSNNINIDPLLVELKNDQQEFNQTLNLFKNNDYAENPNITAVEVVTVQEPQLIALIDEGLQLWQPLNTLIGNMTSVDLRTLRALSGTNAYAVQENLNLLGLMNDLTVALEKDSANNSDILRYIQLAGILLAVAMFSVIVFFFLKQLRKADGELSQAKNETDRILETVNDGLFLMDRKHEIGTQHSESLVEVINVKEPAGKDFLSILRKIVPEKTLQTAKDYLDLLYGDRVNEELVTDLNPLDNVEVYFGGDDLNRDVGHLGFQFKRVMDDKEVSHLLVQVEDITEKVKLEKELAESEEKAQAQFDLMLEVLHVNPKMLGQFLNESENSLREVNTILQERSRTEKDNKKKLEAISRHIHRIKGDAAGLELQGFEQKAHEFEDLIASLNKQPKLSGKDFLPLAISLDAFMGQIDSLRSLITKLSELQGSVSQGEIVDQAQLTEQHEENLSSTLIRLSNSVAKKQNKKVMVNLFNEYLLPSEYSKEVQDILTQLVRNSIAHGIEDPQHRINNKKATEGLINVKFSQDNETKNFIMEYTDDGQGLNEEKILESAIRKGLITEQAGQSLSKNQIMSLIFKPGFSTKETTDMDAGRGVGMDVVSDLVKKIGGKMGIKSIENKMFKLVIKFPKTESTFTTAEAL